MKRSFLPAAFVIIAGCGETAQQPPAPESAMGTLVKVDSIGVEMGEPEYTFGVIEGAVACPDGNIAVLDRGACCIRVYTPEGDFVRQISNEGHGPGELISNAFLAITGDGTLLTTGDGGEVLGLHAFDYASGEWLGSWPSNGTPPTNLTGAGGDTYMRKNLEVDFSTGEPEVVVTITLNRIGAEDELVVFMEDRMPLDMEDMAGLVSLVWFGYDLATDGSGTFYVAPRSTERAVILAFDDAGTELYTITPNIEPVLRTEEEIEIERLVLQAKATAMGDDIPIVGIDPYKPLIRGLEVDAEGNLWAMLGGPAQPEFMVFAPGGEFLRRVTLEGEQPDGASWIFRMQGGRILAWAEDPADGYQKLWMLQER